MAASIVCMQNRELLLTAQSILRSTSTPKATSTPISKPNLPNQKVAQQDSFTIVLADGADGADLHHTRAAANGHDEAVRTGAHREVRPVDNEDDTVVSNLK